MKNKETNQIVIYETEDGQTQIDVRLDGETVWLTRQQLADLFNRNYKTISKHINNALKEELEGEEVVAKFANTTQHGDMEGKTQTHEVEYFNLEMRSFRPVNWNLPSEPFLHNGKHIFVAKADHSHKGALHAGKAGNKDKGTEGVIVPRSKMIHGQIDN